ncbi:MAG: hypothetical protein FJ333_00200 [Sphingomonadales bacterium]|nr:hypothetical protein [Sphingomonadales bacterium]
MNQHGHCVFPYQVVP